MRLLRFAGRLVLWLGLSAVVAAAVGQPSLKIWSITTESNGVALAWTNLGPGFSYVVQSRGAVDADAWIPRASDAAWPIGAAHWTDARAARNGMRFYRVVAVTHSVPARGRLVSVQLQRAFTKQDVALLAQLAGVKLDPQNGVSIYKALYETIDPFGLPAVASGAVVLPDPGPSYRARPVVSYQHGTVANRADVPSNVNTEALVGIVFAAGGYVATMPDYLGLGDSPGFHPYHHAGTEAAATIDLLRAAARFCNDQHVTLSGQLFLLGYSHGGHATMAAHRALEADPTGEFEPTAVAPMAGAYDLSGTTAADFLSDRPMPSPYYFALLLSAFQNVYQVADSFTDLLQAPYAQALPPLLDGAHDGSEIDRVMPNVAKRVVKPEFLEAFRADPNHPLRAALRANDVYDWTPRAPMRLYYCGGDMDVLPANTEVALARFRERGATQVQVVVPSATAAHGACALPSLLDAKAWFDTLVRR
jgi:hypothetical protein